LIRSCLEIAKGRRGSGDRGRSIVDAETTDIRASESGFHIIRDPTTTIEDEGGLRQSVSEDCIQIEGQQRQ